MIDTQMEGKYILVTGASSGIGESVARHLSGQGAIVVMVARNEERMNVIKEELNNTAYVYPYDLTNTKGIENIFRYCKEQGFKLNGLVHSAGFNNDKPIKAVTVEDMENSMSLHYYSYVEMGKWFSNKKYSNDGGSIVAISSMASFVCEKGMSQYSASKAAVNSVTKTMSKEFAKRKIRVNAVAPAFVDTDMAWRTSNYVENFEENLKIIQPLGMIPTKHIAYITEFLLSEVSTYITGTVIPISAGN